MIVSSEKEQHPSQFLRIIQAFLLAPWGVFSRNCWMLTDYETLRALDADNVPTALSMTEEEINALPVHKYKVAGPQK